MVEAGPGQPADGVVGACPRAGEVWAPPDDLEHAASRGDEPVRSVGHARAQDVDALDRASLVEAVDAVAGADIGGVALGGRDHEHRGAVVARGLGAELAGGRLEQELADLARLARERRG